MSSKHLSALQINTAADVLRNAFNKRQNDVAEQAFNRAKIKFTKHAPAVLAISKKAVELYNEMLKLKKEAEKNPKLQLNLDDYSFFTSKLPHTIDDSDIGEMVTAKNSNRYSDKYGKFTPNWDKEEAKIEEFILNLKLGTALMADLQPMLEMIANLK